MMIRFAFISLLIVYPSSQYLLPGFDESTVGSTDTAEKGVSGSCYQSLIRIIIVVSIYIHFCHMLTIFFLASTDFLKGIGQMKADKPVEFASDRMLQLSVWQRGAVIGNSRFQLLCN